MPFEQAYQSFIENHHARRTGERKGRLLRGHNYAEKLLLQQVWWPLFGNFDNLHPEYEIYDWNRKSQFLDFAFLTPFGEVCRMLLQLVIGPHLLRNLATNSISPEEKEVLRLAVNLLEADSPQGYHSA